MTTLWCLLIIVYRAACGDLNVTNYHSQFDLKRENTNAIEIGTTQVPTKLDPTHPITVTLWANKHELPRDLCEASTSTQCGKPLWVYLDMGHSIPNNPSGATPDITTSQVYHASLSHQLHRLRTINEAFPSVGAPIDLTATTAKIATLQKVESQLSIAQQNLVVLDPAKRDTAIAGILDLQQQQNALLDQLRRDMDKLSTDIGVKLRKLADLVKQQHVGSHVPTLHPIAEAVVDEAQKSQGRFSRGEAPRTQSQRISHKVVTEEELMDPEELNKREVRDSHAQQLLREKTDQIQQLQQKMLDVLADKNNAEFVGLLQGLSNAKQLKEIHDLVKDNSITASRQSVETIKTVTDTETLERQLRVLEHKHKGQINALRVKLNTPPVNDKAISAQIIEFQQQHSDEYRRMTPGVVAVQEQGLENLKQNSKKIHAELVGLRDESRKARQRKELSSMQHLKQKEAVAQQLARGDQRLVKQCQAKAAAQEQRLQEMRQMMDENTQIKKRCDDALKRVEQERTTKYQADRLSSMQNEEKLKAAQQLVTDCKARAVAQDQMWKKSMKDLQQEEAKLKRENIQIKQEHDALKIVEQECSELKLYFSSLEEAFLALDAFKDAMFARFTLIRAFKQGPAYVSGVLPAAKACTRAQTSQQTRDDYTQFLDCMMRQTIDGTPYITEFTQECQKLVDHPIIAHYLHQIFRLKGWKNTMDGTPLIGALPHIVQVTMLNDCERQTDETRILLCLVCRWVKFGPEEFRGFIQAGTNAVQKLEQPYREHVTQELRNHGILFGILGHQDDHMISTSWVNACRSLL